MTPVARAAIVTGQLIAVAVACDGCSRGHNVYAWLMVAALALTSSKEAT